jgi:replicative superfamily II helicase
VQLEQKVKEGNFYGLGESVRQAVFDIFDIKDLHKWQKNMLKKHLVEEKGVKNGLLLAPTNGGKTLAAVIVMLHTILIEKKDAIYTVPFVAIAAEKVREMKNLAVALSNKFLVAEYAGNRGRFPPPKQRSGMQTLYVATYEKANGLLKCLSRDDRGKEIGCVVMDEFHMVGNENRGSVLEEVVVNLLKWNSSNLESNNISLLALSATIGNPVELATFLGGGNANGCTMFSVDSRPKKIKEHVIVGKSAIPIKRTEDGRGSLDIDSAPLRDLLDDDEILADSKLGMFKNRDERLIAKLVFESMDTNSPALVFCSSRQKCVELCHCLTEAYKFTHG